MKLLGWAGGGLGGWFVFDGLVSLFWFSKIDETQWIWQDQAVRVVRIAAGLLLIVLSLLVE